MPYQDLCPVSTDELRRLYRHLGSLRLLAEYLNMKFLDSHFDGLPVTYSTVRNWAIKRGIDIKPPGGPNRRANNQDK